MSASTIFRSMDGTKSLFSSAYNSFNRCYRITNQESLRFSWPVD